MTDDGQALVEFALVLPFLIVLTLAVVLTAEVGVARLALAHAAAEGARVASLTNDDEEVRRAIREAVAPLDPARVSARIVPAEDDEPRSSDPRGSLVRVTLDYTVALPLTFAGLPSTRLRGTAARIVEWTP